MPLTPEQLVEIVHEAVRAYDRLAHPTRPGLPAWAEAPADVRDRARESVTRRLAGFPQRLNPSASIGEFLKHACGGPDQARAALVVAVVGALGHHVAPPYPEG